MSSMLSSQVLVLATAMVVSGTLIFLAFPKQKSVTPQVSKNQNSVFPSQKLRSCFCSGEKKEGKGKDKRRVQFAVNVKETKGNGEDYRRERENLLFGRQEKENPNSRIVEGPCMSQIQGIRGMPANRISLYSGILKDVRVHRMERSY